MTFGSLFSGRGGFDLGFERAGMECLWQCEIEPNARKVLKNHWPDVKLYEDVTKIKIKELARVDVICGGFPCQDLSIAGKRKGLAGERSGLWHEFHRILKGVRPAWCVIENVPGLLSSDEGRDFSIILSGLVELGYCISWRVCDAQYHGLAQRRERVFIVGSLGNGRSAEVLFDSESGIGNPAPSRKTRKENTDGVRNGIAGTLGSHTTGGWGGQDIDGTGAWIPELSHTLADPTKGGSNDLNRLGALMAYTIQSNDGGDHKRKDRPNGGLYVKETDVSLTVGSTDQTVITGSVSSKWAKGSGGTAGDECYNLVCGTNRAAKSPDDNDAEQNRLIVAFNARQDCVSGELPGSLGSSLPQSQAVLQRGVRRLTPTECGRLQGFDDGWTDGLSDSAKYRAYGNAVAVSVAYWIGKRIVEADGE